MLPAPVEELATDQWRHQIDLNITGLMNVIGAFVPQLVKTAAERGVADLVNTSPIAASRADAAARAGAGRVEHQGRDPASPCGRALTPPTLARHGE